MDKNTHLQELSRGAVGSVVVATCLFALDARPAWAATVAFLVPAVRAVAVADQSTHKLAASAKGARVSAPALNGGPAGLLGGSRIHRVPGESNVGATHLLGLYGNEQLLVPKMMQIAGLICQDSPAGLGGAMCGSNPAPAASA